MITKEKFLDYENIRKCGPTNMFDIKAVIILSTSGLTKEDCLDIMKNYSQYKYKYLTAKPTDEEIECPCDDPSCPGKGIEDENGHIENCPCGECHRFYGKL